MGKPLFYLKICIKLKDRGFESLNGFKIALGICNPERKESILFKMHDEQVKSSVCVWGGGGCKCVFASGDRERE